MACASRSSSSQDLYYRLKGATIAIPPLRDRTDVVALARHPVGDTTALAPQALAAIARYPWPGNVRELKAVLAVARIACSGGSTIELADLPGEIASAPAPAPPTALDDAERDALVRALAESRNNVSEAARRLGVARSTVHRMKRRYGIA